MTQENENEDGDVGGVLGEAVEDVELTFDESEPETSDEPAEQTDGEPEPAGEDNPREADASDAPIETQDVDEGSAEADLRNPYAEQARDEDTEAVVTFRVCPADEQFLEDLTELSDEGSRGEVLRGIVQDLRDEHGEDVAEKHRELEQLKGDISV